MGRCWSAWSTSARAPAGVLDAPRRRRGARSSRPAPRPHHHRAVLTLVGEDAPAGGGQAGRRAARSAHPRGRPSPSGCGRRRALRPARRLDDGRRGRRPATASRRGRPPSWRCPASCYGRRAPTLPDCGATPGRRAAPDRRSGRTPPDAPARSAWAPGACWWPTTSGWPSRDVALARRVASAVRGPAMRALGLAVGDRAQVSMNLVAPLEVGPAAAYDLVGRGARAGRGRRRRAGRSPARGRAAGGATGALAGARSGRRSHDRGPAGATGGPVRP